MNVQKRSGNHAQFWNQRHQNRQQRIREEKVIEVVKTDCGVPLRELCVAVKSPGLKDRRQSIHKLLYDKMHQKLTKNKAYHRRLIKRRSATVEPVLGTPINHMNLKRVNTRGMAGATNIHSCRHSVII